MDDERSMSRLRAIADAARVELDAAARERVARNVGQVGPGVLRRAERVRLATRAGGVIAVLALAVMVARRGGVNEAQVAKHDAPPAPSTAPLLAPQPSAPALPCRARTELAALSSVDAADGGQRVVLGAAGVVVADARTAMWIDAADACKLRVRLSEGRVSVHAADLGGGELRVSTADGEVRVHGTTFAVARDERGLTVDVDEGRVSVARGGRELASALTGGQRLRARPNGEPVIEALPEAAREALRRAVADEPASPAAAATTQDAAPSERVPAGREGGSAERLVAEATALWKRGAHDDARARYRQAGLLRGPNAEAAWLALARRELEAGRPDAAQAALDARRQRFGKGDLAGEASGIAFRIALQSGDDARIRRLAEELQRRYAGTPQGEAAARWLHEHPGR